MSNELRVEKQPSRVGSTCTTWLVFPAGSQHPVARIEKFRDSRSTWNPHKVFLRGAGVAFDRYAANFWAAKKVARNPKLLDTPPDGYCKVDRVGELAEAVAFVAESV